MVLFAIILFLALVASWFALPAGSTTGVLDQDLEVVTTASTQKV
jgi:hypothetical protein